MNRKKKKKKGKERKEKSELDVKPASKESEKRMRKETK